MAIEIQRVLSSLLVDAVKSKQRVTARIERLKRLNDPELGNPYGFAETSGGSVLLRSENFRDPTIWRTIRGGESVSFLVEAGNKGFTGKDILLEK